mgnify:FL=1|jgi:hypothetical protein
MGIFRDITKSLKKAAPIIGGTIGFALGGPTGAAIGSGIGSLASGRSVEESLVNAAMGYGIGSAAKYAGFGTGTGTGMERFLPSYKGNAALGFGTPSSLPSPPPSRPISAVKSSGNGIMDFMSNNKMLTGSLALSGAGLLAGNEKETPNNSEMRAYGPYQSRLGIGRIGDARYNLNDESERKAYFKANQNRGIFADGGEVEGPGTGTSDSVPARLSDGEFVVTAQAVRGAGGGDRDVGAARMYDMMSQLERAA